MTDSNPKSKNDSIRESSEHNHCQLLVHVPVRVNYLQTIPVDNNVRNWTVHRFKNKVLTAIMNCHSDPDHADANKSSVKPF